VVAVFRHVRAAGLLASLVALFVIGAQVAGGQSVPPLSQPRADHIGVVVTAGEVLMSWHRLEGADAGTAIVRRAEGGACPGAPAEGSLAGEVTPLHVIDRTVHAGRAYCYTLFSRPTSGAVRRIGSSGLVRVPDVSVVPAAMTLAPAPVVTVTATTPSLARTLAFAGAGALAVLLVAVVVAGSALRVAGGRAMRQPTTRGSTRMQRRLARGHTEDGWGAARALEVHPAPYQLIADERPPLPARGPANVASAESMDAVHDMNPRLDRPSGVQPTALSTKPDQIILAYASAYAAAWQRGDSDPMAAVVGIIPPTTPDPATYASEVVAEARRRHLLTGPPSDVEVKLSARALRLLHGSTSPTSSID
jgi:hypothetical protein